MPKKEVPIDHLQNYLPPDTGDAVMAYLHQFKVHLTIAKERKSILGDYRHRTHHSNHRISVNGNLNKFSFLITLLHELAHLLTHEQYGHRIAPHGNEWKKIYSGLLADYLPTNIFPDDVKKELHHSLQKPGASSCSETNLIRVLRKYDSNRNNEWVHIEELSEGTLFEMHNGKNFIKGEKLRKRFMCTEQGTGLKY